MSIIKCPECGRQVSERAPICPNCGVEIAGKVSQCEHCGEYFFTEDGHCTSCHTAPKPHSTPRTSSPAHTSSAPHQSSPDTSSDSSATAVPTKKHGTLIVSFIIASLLCGIFFYFYSGKNTEKETKEYEIAMKNEDPLVLQAYLNNYADVNAEHTKNIKDRLAFLQAGESEWVQVMSADTRNAYTDYLNTHPDTPHSAYIKNKIDSLDWVTATTVPQDKSEQAMNKYLVAHPDGAHASEAKETLSKIAEEKKDTTVTGEEKDHIFATIRKFFQSINSKSEGGLRTVVSATLSKIVDRPETGIDAAIAYMYDLYKSNVSNINWYLDRESLNITKHPDGANTSYDATIKARKVTDNKDGSKSEKSYDITITIGSDGLIESLSY